MVPLRPAGGVSFVDMHCHCLGGLDDGPATLEQSIALCRALYADGIRQVIATPHQLGNFAANTAGMIRQAVSELKAELKRLDIALEILAGAEVRVDERLIDMLDAGEILTLSASRRYILLEMPAEVFFDITMIFNELDKRGIRAIIAHAERNRVIAGNPEVVSGWIKRGVLVQITAGSVAGDFGDTAQRAGWYFIQRYPAATLIASDAHNLKSRSPRMKAAYRLINDRLGIARARRVCVDGPMAIVTATTSGTRTDTAVINVNANNGVDKEGAK